MGNLQTAEQTWPTVPGAELLNLGRAYRRPLGQLRLQRAPTAVLRRREAWALAVVALLLHGGVLLWVSLNPAPALPIVPPEVPPMTIEFSRPAPPVVEPAPPEAAPATPVVEPPPVEDALASKPPPPKPLPTPQPKLKPKPVAKPVAKPVVAPATPAPKTPQPVAPPSPPAPPAPAPVTPASANAGYLKNPAPEYPSLALRRGWEGTVLLRVQVLASGKPGEIQVQKSSGRQQLDDAALNAVKRWSFVPAKQGDVAQVGWVSVPIDFKIH